MGGHAAVPSSPVGLMLLLFDELSLQPTSATTAIPAYARHLRIMTSSCTVAHQALCPVHHRAFTALLDRVRVEEAHASKSAPFSRRV
jgi:hypothetical protein